MRKNIFLKGLVFVIISILFGACKKYLDLKPEGRLSTPQTANDLLAILDFNIVMNNGYPGLLEIAADNYYLDYSDWAAMGIPEYQMPYIWNQLPVHNDMWNIGYQQIFYANTVIDLIDKVSYTKQEFNRDEILGIAYFYRAYSLFHLAQAFSVPYRIGDAVNRMGLVLKLNSDIGESLGRSNLEQTYRQIISDLETAVDLLPSGNYAYPTRPNKTAAFAAMSRLYLCIGDYVRAAEYAVKCLEIKSETLNYKTIIAGSPYPFEQYNSDVIFFSTISTTSVLQNNYAKVDTILYHLYSDADTRKQLFFSVNDDGSYAFTGSYQSIINNQLFNGLTVSEVLLIRAECAARLGDEVTAKEYLMKLLHARYTSMPELNEGEELLKQILDERRKELVFRGLRWMDLRRFATSTPDSIQLQRKMDGQQYMLTGIDLLEFAFSIPQMVIDRGEVVQNP